MMLRTSGMAHSLSVYSLITFGLIAPSLAAESSSAITEYRSTLQDQQEVAVTIYNDNLALIKDSRSIKLTQGIQALALRDVSAQIQPETALLRSVSHPGSLRLLEQSFDFDLLTPQKLLEKYIGQQITVIKTNPATGIESSEAAIVLAAHDGIVLQMAGRIETGIPGRIVYPDVPQQLRDRPTLVVQLDNRQAGQQHVELSYLTGGLGWQADYVAELNAAEHKLDLFGWVTLSNTSGTSYRNARLQLVAGDVHRVQRQAAMAMQGVRKTLEMADTAAMTEESLLEYHLYSLARPTTIVDNQSKQVALLSAPSVPVKKELLLRGADYYYHSSYGDLGQKIKASVFIEFDNKQQASLGMPLPKGIVRVYKKDNGGNVQFVGEDSIDHTPRNEKVRLKLGESFDVTADRKQMDFKKLPDPEKGSRLSESSYQIVIRNTKSEAVKITVQEPIPGDWKILRSSHPYTKMNRNMAAWEIMLPDEGSVILTYTTQVKH